MVGLVDDVARRDEARRVEGILQPHDLGQGQHLAQRLGGVVAAAEERGQLEDQDRQARGLGDRLVIFIGNPRIERIVEEGRRREDRAARRRPASRADPGIGDGHGGRRPAAARDDLAPPAGDLPRHADHLGPLVGGEIGPFAGIDIDRDPGRLQPDHPGEIAAIGAEIDGVVLVHRHDDRRDDAGDVLGLHDLALHFGDRDLIPWPTARAAAPARRARRRRGAADGARWRCSRHSRRGEARRSGPASRHRPRRRSSRGPRCRARHP